MTTRPALLAVRSAFALLLLTEVFGWIFLPDVKSDFTWLGLILTGGFVWGILELLRLPAIVAWLAFAGVVLDAASALLELYSRIIPWDLWMHALGGAVIAAGALELVRRGLKSGSFMVEQRYHRAVAVTGVYLATVAIGFLYEFGEYLVDKFQYGEPRSLVSAYDSIEDQLMNIAGATAVLAAYYLWKRWRRKEANL